MDSREIVSGSRRNGAGGMPVWYRLCRSVLLIGAKALYGFTVHGVERVPAVGPLIVAANHTRNSDTAFGILAIPRRARVMVKKEAFHPPFARLLGLVAFPVDRAKMDLRALREAQSILSDGEVVGIAPEGSRWVLGKDEKTPKGGLAWLAVRSGVSVLPIHLGEAPGVMDRLRGERMVVHVGELVEVNRALRGARAWREATAEIMDQIDTLGKDGGIWAEVVSRKGGR